MNLRARLFLTNFLVLSLGLSCAATVGNSYKAYRFPNQLLQLQGQSKDENIVSQLNTYSETLDLFHKINTQGTILAISVSLLGVGALSFSFLRSILLPLKHIEQVAKQFSAGDLNARILPSKISEIRHLELTLNSVADRLQGVEERRQELISDLAHEMSTPMTVIHGYLNRLNTTDFELTPDLRQQLHEESLRMVRLLRDLKILSKVEAGNLPLQLQPFLPVPAMQWVVKSLQMKGWQNNCQLVVESPNYLPKIFADIDRFKQVLTNLISNALAYTPAGTVTLRAWAEQDMLKIEVQDTGIGIASQELPFVFDRFWRSPASRHLRIDGSGIGLAITKRLTKAMNGEIEVTSRLGQGTTFKVSFPLDAPVSAQSESG
jgi:signal transduction histidine kinase